MELLSSTVTMVAVARLPCRRYQSRAWAWRQVAVHTQRWQKILMARSWHFC